MNHELQQAKALKQALTDFVFDAEDELATALEAYSAEQLRPQQVDMHRRELVVDRFLVEGQVGKQTPIDLFIEQHPDLTASEKLLLQTWRRGFVGLFTITQVLADGLELMNWTTAKVYRVQLSDHESTAAARLDIGDIVLGQIAPAGSDWMFFSPWISLGKLGKPKLAVAIGNFKQNYRSHLYSDAPELLAEAWKSVERHYQQFIDFFGSNEITMPGYQLSKKLTEFQEVLTQKQLEEAGIDASKSLTELAAEAGISEEEIAEAATEMGADAKVLEQVLQVKQSVKVANKMMAPPVELPPDLKKAEQVTIIADPRWGQVFLSNYMQFKSALSGEPAEAVPGTKNQIGDQAAGAALAKKYLQDSTIPAFVWHCLAQAHPVELEAVLKQVLDQPDFNLKTDLDAVLQKHGKSLETELPEIASVPLHLHNLFQEAVAEVSKDRAKKKIKPKAKGGFQR